MTSTEDIARALCRAEGFNPDELALPYPAAIGPLGMQIVRPDDLIPSWHLYANHVRGTLDMILSLPAPDDMRGMLERLLAGDAISAEELTEAEPNPQPAPDWRYKMGLRT